MNKTNINTSYRAACEGMVLLENRENLLPLRDKTIALIGADSFEYRPGGGGSSKIFCGKIPTLPEKLSESGLSILPESLNPCEAYTSDVIADFAKRASVAVAMFGRNTGEGADRPVSDFELKEEERELLRLIEESDFESAVIILNIGSPIDVASIKKCPKVGAILLAWQAGMCGAEAICDILTGKVNPSGRLTDTLAEKYEDYPSAEEFDSDLYIEYYSEDVFVGYRYFETFAKEKVVYPFGYGLSYTSFDISARDITSDGEKLDIKIAVKNTGDVSGKETIQVYHTSPESAVMRPSLELSAYAKTKLLAPGEEEVLSISFKISDMAYFDEESASFVLDAGEYEILCGRNIRDTISLGAFFAEMRTVVGTTTLKYTNKSPRKLTREGKFVDAGVCDRRCTIPTVGDAVMIPDATDISLFDVADGKMTLDEFVSKLSVAQLIGLSYGKEASVIRGTGGIGNMPKLGILNPQTADGPAGVRRTVPTVCFPCATALACSWNRELLFDVGSSLGDECEEHNVDILLAPGLNIHRNPLCGRNFEYFSEDPVVSGYSAASIVNGVQSHGIGATIKHFAANNRESNRKQNDSRVSERALREIYLKGFEIAVKESKPWCVMTSYNSLNGTFTSASRHLIEGILRGEWGFDGLVMSDWTTTPKLKEEILAGNNLKMPYPLDGDIEATNLAYEWKSLRRETLEENAKTILRLIMKTKCFLRRDLGILHTLKDGENEIRALDVRTVSADIVGYEEGEDGKPYLYRLGQKAPGRDTVLIYRIGSDKERKVKLSAIAACEQEGLALDIRIDDEIVESIDLAAEEYSLDARFESEAKAFTIPKGECELAIIIRNSQYRDCMRLWSFKIEG